MLRSPEEEDREGQHNNLQVIALAVMNSYNAMIESVTYFSLESKKSRSNNLTFAIINSIYNLQPKLYAQAWPSCYHGRAII